MQRYSQLVSLWRIKCRLLTAGKYVERILVYDNSMTKRQVALIIAMALTSWLKDTLTDGVVEPQDRNHGNAVTATQMWSCTFF